MAQELKRFDIVGKYSDELTDAITIAKSYYLKDEADKVIKELKEGAKNLILDNYLKDREIKRQKYKRCLAMAQEWRNYAAFCGMQSACHNHRGFGKTATKWTWKEIHAWKCVKRWLALTEKFKEAK